MEKEICREAYEQSRVQICYRPPLFREPGFQPQTSYGPLLLHELPVPSLELLGLTLLPDSPSPDLEPARCLPHGRFLYKGTQAPAPRTPHCRLFISLPLLDSGFPCLGFDPFSAVALYLRVLSMTPLGRLCFLRVLVAPPVFLTGLLLVLPLGVQGLSGVRFSAARTVHQLPQKYSTHGILKPAAHLVGYLSKQNSLLWRANTDHAFLQHGFSLNNNSLLVPSSGLYFVYSQAVFSGESYSPQALPTPIYLGHEVQLFSSQYPFHMPLLSAQKSVYPGLQGPWVHSMYQGAVFLLSKGDRLSTHTDGVSHLHFSPSSVFFGAFAL
ncbi:lymphotoxin alpha [Sigmodon hispidus]